MELPFEKDLSLKYMLVVHALPAMMLFVAATDDVPHGFFSLTRVVVCAGACMSFAASNQKNKNIFSFLFVIIAILFNPLFPVHLENRNMWIIMDFLAGCIFSLHFISIVVEKGREKRE